MWQGIVCAHMPYFCRSSYKIWACMHSLTLIAQNYTLIKSVHWATWRSLMQLQQLTSYEATKQQQLTFPCFNKCLISIVDSHVSHTYIA